MRSEYGFHRKRKKNDEKKTGASNVDDSDTEQTIVKRDGEDHRTTTAIIRSNSEDKAITHSAVHR
jgi:hypothetical protein